MTKEEVERLLRHGAYDIFNEEKAGTAEAESKDFIEQDIDSILQRRSRTVVHENTGTGSGAAGGTFSKATFVAPTTPGNGQDKQQEDVDIEDPDFWKKMIGETEAEVESELKPRRRNQANYSERFYERNLHKMIASSPSGSDSSVSASDDDDGSDDDDLDDEDMERARWGGNKPYHWSKWQAMKVLETVERFGYRVLPWDEFRSALLPDCDKFTETEVCYCASLFFISLHRNHTHSLSDNAYDLGLNPHVLLRSGQRGCTVGVQKGRKTSHAEAGKRAQRRYPRSFTKRGSNEFRR